jgi:N-acetylmuramoyl-L-alanine amidase
MKMDDPVPELPVVEEARVEPVDAKSVNDPEPEVVEAQQPEVNLPVAEPQKSESKKLEPKKPAASSEAPVFKVQILSSSSKLKTTDARFKGLKDIDCYKDGGMYKYTVGASTNYNEIYRLRKEVAAKIPEAFIIAFKDGKRMDVNAAIREFKSKK